MGGIWPPNVLAGSYINFESSGSTPVQPGTFGLVGMPIRANWGPENEFVDIVTDADRIATYGNVDGDVNSTADTSWLIREAILGGAELVKAYRMVGAGASAATGVLVDSGPQTVLNVSAKYVGTRANLMRVRVAQNSIFTFKQDLFVEELSGANWQQLEKWTYDADDVSRLADRINNATSGSNYITVTLNPAASLPVNEVQRLTATARTSAGSYRLQFYDGVTSAITNDIAWNATPATVATELGLLSNIGAGNVTVTGSNLSAGSFTLTRDAVVAGAGETAQMTISVNGAAPVNTADLVEGVTDGNGIAAALTAVAGGPVISCTAGQLVDIGVANTVYTFASDRDNIVVTFDNTLGASPMSGGSGADAVASAQADPATAAGMNVTFTGPLAGMNVFALTVAGGSVTPLVGGPVVVSTLTEGSPTQNEVQTLTASVAVTGTYTITVNDGSGSKTTAPLAAAATAAQVQTALEGLVGVGNITVTGSPLSVLGNALTVSFVGALTGQNMALITTSITGTGTITVATTSQGAPNALVAQTVALSGGSNGAAATLASYTAAMTAFEAEGGFDLFCLDGANEEQYPGLNVALKVWADTNNDAGRYVMVVVGGGSTELANAGGAGVATALARTGLFDSEWVVNVGVSGLKINSPANNTLNLTSAQSAARVAGLIAASGITGSITFSEVVGAAGVNGPMTPTQLESVTQQGVVSFSKRGTAIRVEDGITSFISVTEEKDFTFTQIRAVRAIQTIGTDIQRIVEEDWIGKKVNTTSVRDSLVTRLQGYFAQLEAARVLVNGTQVSIDTRYVNTRTDVYVLVLAQFQFELKRVLLTVRVPTVS